jgi:DNA-binding phage protein
MYQNRLQTYNQPNKLLLKNKMPNHKAYHSYLIESLQDPAEASAYLDAVLEDGDLQHILMALKNVIEAHRNSIARP